MKADFGIRTVAVMAIFFCAGAANAGIGNNISMRVDAREVQRRIVHTRLAFPARPGDAMLYYPKWLPGEHGPTGPVTDVAGLTLTAGGERLAWERDPEDMYAIRCLVPAGADSLIVEFDFLPAPPGAEKFTSAASSTTRLAVLSWNQLLFYPAGSSAREVSCQLDVDLPAGWDYATALETRAAHRDRVSFATATLEQMVDSPMLCGEFLNKIDIGAPGGAGHWIAAASDSRDAVRMNEEQHEGYSRLVDEALALFGGRHYGRYTFLLSMSDYIAHFGLEHHESSDNRTPERMLADPGLHLTWCSLLPHEYVHSWNGKYRRAEDMAAPDFHSPMHTRLLWVYEGLTTHLGYVLTARSGLWSAEDFRQATAFFADWVRNQKGRTWRPLLDTAVAAHLLYEARGDWSAWRRGVDFYREGFLIWLEIDMIIRERSRGRRTLDDFCAAFFGGSGPAEVKTYNRGDVVRELGRAAPYDWEGYLESRLSGLGDDAPLGGIERGGWKLGYAGQRNGFQKQIETNGKVAYLTSSIGVLVRQDGTIADVIPGSAADSAGLAPAMKIVGVNSRSWDLELLRRAVAATARGGGLELLVNNSGELGTIVLDYDRGARYPVLVRDEGRPDLLSEVIAPRASSGGGSAGQNR